MMDKIFKIGLLVLGFGYLSYLYCPHTDQVGRYSLLQRDNTYTYIMDTTTGGIYYHDVHSDKWHLSTEIQWKNIKEERVLEREYQERKAKKGQKVAEEWEKAEQAKN